MAKKSKEELELYKNFWLRHIDIIQREESIISDILEYYDIDTTSLAIYDSEGKKFQNAREFDETQLLLKAENALSSGMLSEDVKAFMERRKISELMDDDVDEEGSSAKSASAVKNKLRYREEVVESASENLGDLEILANLDEIVTQYDTMEDVPEESYPPSYVLVTPKAVLKAMYYAT